MPSDGWIRPGYQSVNPYIVVDSPDLLIRFLCEVFECSERGAREIDSSGSIGHAEVQLGDSVVMMSEASTEHPARPSVNFVYVVDVDDVYRRAVNAGATQLREPWGDRVAGFHDPFDNRWWVATCLQSRVGA
jgi:PhnB protein